MGLFKRRDRKRKYEELMTDAVYDAALGEAYTIRFLFAEKPQMPDREIVQRVFEKRLHSSLRYMDPLSGELTVISSQKETWAFAVEEQEFAMGEERSWYQIILSEIYKLNQYTEREEAYALKQALRETKLACHYEVELQDGFAFGIESKARGDLLMDGVEAVMELFPECLAVWNSVSGKLVMADEIRNTMDNKDERYVNWAVNTRCFRVQGSKTDLVLDTLGMAAIGMPDIQYHFHSLNPDELKNHALNVAFYMYENNSPVKSGDMIDGLEDGHMSQAVQWTCQYEESIAEPRRSVLDIAPGAYAAGR